MLAGIVGRRYTACAYINRRAQVEDVVLDYGAFGLCELVLVGYKTVDPAKEIELVMLSSKIAVSDCLIDLVEVTARVDRMFAFKVPISIVVLSGNPLRCYQSGDYLPLDDVIWLGRLSMRL
jgi:hypothetical protein